MFYMVIITKRELENAYFRFFEKNRMHMVLSGLCKGTAQQKMLDYLGIEKTEKMMFHAIADYEHKNRIFEELAEKMDLDIPGNGIAFSIPLSCIGGQSGLKYFAKNEKVEVSEDNLMDNTKYSLIVAVAEKGTSDIVMDAARRADAQGGTVVQAKEVESDQKEKFFGIAIAKEKDMIYILTKRESRDGIMTSIMEYAGAETDAKCILYSLPVDRIAGLRRDNY